MKRKRKSASEPVIRGNKRQGLDYESLVSSAASNYFLEKMSFGGSPLIKCTRWKPSHNYALKQCIIEDCSFDPATGSKSLPNWQSILQQVQLTTGCHYNMNHLKEGLLLAQAEFAELSKHLIDVGGFQTSVVADLAEEETRTKKRQKKFTKNMAVLARNNHKKQRSGSRGCSCLRSSARNVSSDSVSLRYDGMGLMSVNPDTLVPETQYGHINDTSNGADLVWSINQCIKDVEANFGELSIRDFVAATAYFKDFNIREVYMSASLPRREGLVLQFKSIPT